MSELEEFFGETISAYSRAEAIADGSLVDVTETAREAGIRFPVAVTRAVWESCVAWDERAQRKAYQDESGRLWDVVWMTMMAIRKATNRGTDRITVELHRIPREGRATTPKLVTLTAYCGPGDEAAPVITIMQPGED